MKEDFVTYDLAVKLKEKGFRERVRGHYKSERHLSVCSEPINCNGSASGDISAPQIHEVLKWLREEKKIHIDIGIWDCKYIPFIVYIDVLDENIVHTNKTVDVDDCKLFDTYEQAAIAGVTWVLDNLI